MTDIVMPQMGESIVEGTLTRWLKKPGDRIERDEPLFEISTDKVDTEIPSPSAGVLKEVLVQEGATVAINSVVARLDDGSGAQTAPAPEQQAPQPSAEPQVKSAPETKPDVEVGSSAAVPEARTAAAPPPAPAPRAAGPYPIEPPPQPGAAYAAAQPAGEDQGPLSPLVRRMAREYNIDLAQIKGTGAGGRITKQDLEAYMSSQAARTYAAAAPPLAAPPQPAPPAMPLPEAARIRT
ncbi:MAG: biotin/lipoyl-containing protein, partial [Bryobacteraceae bacterium]